MAFIEALPKAELHVHHVGSASARIVSELAERHPGTVPSDPDRLRDFFAFRDFAHFVEVYLAVVGLIRTADDIRDVHQIMDEEGLRLPVIAKIEKPQAVENLDEIIRAFDGVMVARGDLGVEMPLEEVPLVQKRACEIARRRAKPVIVATQVLESMIENSRPTRAEASDAANAVLDGADALMLSGETSVGKNPFAAVRTWRYRIEHLRIDAPEGFEQATHAARRRPAAAAGDGVADFIGVDLSW